MPASKYRLPHLNDGFSEELRALMHAEFVWAFERGKLYFSKRFTQLGHKEYPRLLEEALMKGTPESVIQSLSAPGLFTAEAPNGSAEVFGWDEFNKYYMRALCSLVLAHPNHELIITRGRISTDKRNSSEAQLGRRKDAQEFLTQLRNSPKINPYSGLTLTIRKRKSFPEAQAGNRSAMLSQRR